MEHRLPAVKFAISSTVLRSLSESGMVTPEELAIVHAYLVEALGEVVNLADVKTILPTNGLSLLAGNPLCSVIEKCTAGDPGKFIPVMRKHEKAYNIIQQHLLLRIIED